MNKQELKEWFKDNERVVKITTIGEDAGLPKGAITRWLHGTRALPNKHVEPLKRELQKLKNSIPNE
jgi:hypothetical protein